MWYVAAAAVWLVVGFAFCWLWGSMARFSEDDEEAANALRDYLQEADDPDARDQVIPLPASRQGGR